MSAPSLTFTIKGFAEMANAFKELNVDIQDKIGFAAVGAGSKAFLERIQLNVRGLPWDNIAALYENVAVLRVRSPKFPEVSYEIGVRGTGARGSKDAPFYWWFHEFGYTLRDGTHKEATPFVTPAMADRSTQMEAFNRMRKILAKRIEKANKQ